MELYNKLHFKSLKIYSSMFRSSTVDDVVQNENQIQPPCNLAKPLLSCALINKFPFSFVTYSKCT